MNSLCEDCLISYCSCSNSSWKDDEKLRNLSSEAGVLPAKSSFSHKFLPSSRGNNDDKKKLEKLDQTYLVSTNRGSIISFVEDSVQVIRDDCCSLHSRCAFCSRSMIAASTWKRSVKRKIAQVSNEEKVSNTPKNLTLLLQGSDMRDGTEGEEVGNGEGKYQTPVQEQDGTQHDEVQKLREALESEHEAIDALQAELEEERKASAVAAMETMAMISRLQKEKAAVELEARQDRRLVEEKALYDQEAIDQLNEILLKKEEEEFFLKKEVEFYHRKLLSDRARIWDRETGNMHYHLASGRESEMLLLEEGKDLENVSTERMERFDKTQNLSSNVCYRSTGKKLMDLFDSAACDFGDIASQQVQKGASTSEIAGYIDRMRRNLSGHSPVTENLSFQYLFPVEGNEKEHQQTPASQWRTDAVEPESQMTVSGEHRKVSKTFSRCLQEEGTLDFPKTYLEAVDKRRERGNNGLEIQSVNGKERSSLDWEDSCSASVHDVYEVHHEHHNSSSFITPSRRMEGGLDQDEWDFLEKYGSTWQSYNPLEMSSKTYPLIAEFSSQGRMETLADVECSETVSPENRLVDLKVKGRVGKPEPISGNIAVNDKQSTRKHGLTGKRKQITSLFERENLTTYTDATALDDVGSHSSHLPSDLSVAVSNYNVGRSFELTGDTSRSGVEDKVEQLIVRLQALEEDRESLKQTVFSLKKENSEMQMLQDISQQLRELMRTEREVEDVHESTLSSMFKGIFSFNTLRGSVISHLGRRAHTGGSLEDPIGLTYILANKGESQAVSCLTRGIKAEDVLPAGLASRTEHATRIASIADHIADWPTDTRHRSETAFNGRNL